MRKHPKFGHKLILLKKRVEEFQTAQTYLVGTTRAISLVSVLGGEFRI